MIKRLYTPRFVYDNELDQQRANGLQMMVIFLIGLLILLTAGLVLAELGVIEQSGALLDLDLALALVLVGLGVGLVAIFALLQRGQLDLAAVLMVGLLLLGTIAPIINYEFGPIYLVIPLIAAAVLLGRRALIITAVLVGAGLLLRYGAVSQMDRPIRVVPSREISVATVESFAVIALLFALLYVFGGKVLSLGRDAMRRLQRLERVTALTPQFAAEGTEDALMSHVLLAAQEGFGYALAQLYLIDSNGRIARRLRQGTRHQTLLTSSDANPGEASVIADVFATHAPVIAAASDPQPRAQHLVAPSRYAISLPVLFSTGRVAAVLDFQTTALNPPDASELALLTSLTQSFAAAWERQALVHDQARVIEEQSGQLERLREQVGLFEGRSQQTALGSWENYLRGRGSQRIGFDLVRQQAGLNERDLRPASDLPPEILSALERGELHITVEGDEQVVNVPIRVRELLLGAMAFRLPAGQSITQRQLDTVGIVAERLGTALENLRLYEQNQAQVRRERKASDVTSALLSATDLNSLLSAATDIFNDALGAISTRVTIEPVAAPQPATNGSHAPASQGGNG